MLKDFEDRKFQFTHPGGVRRSSISRLLSEIAVSIHAPGRGATELVLAHCPTLEFQFTHPGGVRRAESCLSFAGWLRFQFTHPGGVRLAESVKCFSFRESFNSRTREGCDLYEAAYGGDMNEFQFTHPGGVRLSSLLLQYTRMCFNSRTREGCDRSARERAKRVRSFNSRTREGCDLLRRVEQLQELVVSIHAPGRGATFSSSRM